MYPSKDTLQTFPWQEKRVRGGGKEGSRQVAGAGKRSFFFFAYVNIEMGKEDETRNGGIRNY